MSQAMNVPGQMPTLPAYLTQQWQPPIDPKAEGAEKVYYNRIKNSAFECQIGPAQTRKILFLDGEYRTKNLLEQMQLDGACDAASSMIYTKEPIIDPGEKTAMKQILENAAKSTLADAGRKA